MGRLLSRVKLMRIAVVPENLVERLILASGAFPTPLPDSWMTFLLARTLMTAVKLGVFEALADGPRTVEEVAQACQTKVFPTQKLLNALIGCSYLSQNAGRYSLRPVTRKWLLAGKPGTVRDRVLFQFLEWDIISRTEDFLRTGEPLDPHVQEDKDKWGLYQRGMRAGVEPMTVEVTRRLKLPPAPKDMLDLGGSHGFWSVAFCRYHTSLRSTVVDLPRAIEHAGPILAAENMGDRVVHRSGDALADDLGERCYDFIFMGNLVHHFDDATNRGLMQRCARALRPGGVVAIFEPFRVEPSDAIGQFGGLLDLFFALTSASGTFSPDEIADWQRAAGLRPRKPFRLRLARELGIQAATRPAGN